MQKATIERSGAAARATAVDSGYSWLRLLASLALSTIAGVGMWSVVVVMPAVQKDFGLTRAEASTAYTLLMIGFGAGGILMGRLADRLGIFRPLLSGIVALSLGYVATSFAATPWQFAIAHGLLIAMLGSAVTFGPLIADVSLWFERRRGIAVAVCASGNYLAGTIWPPVVERLVATLGWRQTHLLIAAFCLLTMLPLAMALRRRSPDTEQPAVPAASRPGASRSPMPLGLLQALLAFAGVACCLAMSMPQVHIVAYCGDLGYGAARGAEMLAVMLGFGIVSRLASGFIADRIGGLRTLLLSSILQMVALVLYVPFDSLVSLYVVSALFGLFQGGIVPSYALVIREYFPAREAGMRVGLTLTTTMIGMAVGGWLSGAIFDFTGSYTAAFVNGIAWNAVNVAIVLAILWKVRATRRH